MPPRSRSRPLLVAIFTLFCASRALAATPVGDDAGALGDGGRAKSQAGDGEAADGGAATTPPLSARTEAAPTAGASDGGADAASDATAPLPPEAPGQTVNVIGKRVFNASALEPESIAASDSTSEQAELRLRPRLRTENVLEAIPSLATAPAPKHERPAAPASTSEQAELRLRPRLRTENVLEAIPGLFTVQHAGGG